MKADVERAEVGGEAPSGGGVIAEGEQLHPGGDLGYQRDYGHPDLVLEEVVQR